MGSQVDKKSTVLRVDLFWVLRVDQNRVAGGGRIGGEFSQRQLVWSINNHPLLWVIPDARYSTMLLRACAEGGKATSNPEHCLHHTVVTLSGH